MLNTIINFNGFRIQLKENKYQFPIENWKYENESERLSLDKLNKSLNNFRSDFEKHTKTGKVDSINFSEDTYGKLLNIAIQSMQNLKKDFTSTDLSFFYEELPIKLDTSLKDDTITVHSYQSI